MAKISVNNEWCKGCGICIEFCPTMVFEPDIEGKPIVVHEEKCTGCKLCSLRCPDFAIKVEVNKSENGQ